MPLGPPSTDNTGRDEGGQATVEFALVLPLLCLLLLGLLQAVVLGVEAARVSAAAREAARAAAVGRGPDGVRDAALRGGGGLDPDRVEVVTTPDPVATERRAVKAGAALVMAAIVAVALMTSASAMPTSSFAARAQGYALDLSISGGGQSGQLSLGYAETTATAGPSIQSVGQGVL